MKGLSEEWLRANYDRADEALANAKPVNVPSAVEPPRRKAAHTKGVMNYTEARFNSLLADGRWPWPVREWAFENEVLQLSPDMTFCPDFNLMLEDGSVHSIDVKGKMTWEDSIIKSKSASVIFPDRMFFVAQLTCGEWRVRQMGVKPAVKFKITA